ncbi:MAG: hypothetical protein R3178_04680, partial [Rhodothermales bacterium]|nr:hypothetical protein [Rhodothermales bacterium]
MISGVPVYRRFVKVNLTASMEPSIVLNGVAPGLERFAVRTSPSVSSAQARQAAVQSLAKGGGKTTRPELQIFPSEPPRLVWSMVLWPDASPGEWEALVDAQTGDIVQLLDLSVHRVELEVNEPYQRSELGLTESSAMATGTGYVFDPDPLTSSGAPYGSPYFDSADGDVAVLNDERILVDLLELSVDNDSNYRLDGPHVQIVGGGSLSPPYQPPALASPDDFRFTRGDDHFEAVNAYYHLDKSQRYVQSLGFLDRQNGALRVNPRAFASDNSFYTPSQNIIEFGIGGVDDAEDAGVLWHEYGHALLESGAAGLNAAGEGQALHEGWSDYWAGSYMRFLAETQVGKRDDWENVFRWDSGDGQIWPGRSLTLSGTYPDDTTCDDPGDPNGDGCLIYSDGLLWATSLMEIYTDLGKNITDRLVIHSHSYLSHPVTFADAAEAIVQADRDLYGGVHTASIVDRLSTRGYLGLVGPIVSHTPLPANENLGSQVAVEVDALQGAAPIESVTLFHRVAGEPGFTEQPLASQSGATYAAQITLPSDPATVEYYIVAVDENTVQTRLPSSISDFYSFDVGPDSEPPSISHIPISLASSALWPAEVVAFVDDNLGVDSVWVDFSIEDGGGTVYDSGSFGLVSNGTDFRGTFTTEATSLQPASTVRYRLTARDAAIAANSSVDPATGQYHFPVVFSGLLQQWDLEITDGNFQSTGVWEYGDPVFTLRAAHSGDRVWGTDLTGTYPDTEGSSHLELPSINLEGLSSVYLVFWHWYDFEYRGRAEPGRLVQGTFWDGGNIKVA